jgi:hypothetical protein
MAPAQTAQYDKLPRDAALPTAELANVRLMQSPRPDQNAGLLRTILIARDAFEDFLARGCRVFPTFHFCPFTLFQILVVLEKMGDAIAPVLRHIGEIVDVVVVGEYLVGRRGDDLAVFAGFVGHAHTPIGRQRITAPGISGSGISTSTSTGSPSPLIVCGT